MTDKSISQADEQTQAPVQGRINPPHRILVVDDDTSLRNLNTAILTQAGYEVDGATDGAAGLQALQSNYYDLLITDNVMPKMTGIEMLKNLRAVQMALPVIMATSKAPTREFASYPWLQPDITLLKPYTVEQMLTAVEVVLRVADAREQGPPLPKERRPFSSYGWELR